MTYDRNAKRSPTIVVFRRAAAHERATSDKGLDSPVARTHNAPVAGRCAIRPDQAIMFAATRTGFHCPAADSARHHSARQRSLPSVRPPSARIFRRSVFAVKPFTSPEATQIKYRDSCLACSRCMRARGKGSSPGRVEGSSRAMLATAMPSCLLLQLGQCTHRSQLIFVKFTSKKYAKSDV